MTGTADDVWDDESARKWNEDLRTITVDYTVEFARVFRGSSPEAAFSFLSGGGADPT